MSSVPAARPRLSVCIITRDRCRYLGKTLQGLRFLASLPFTHEILVSDNCSSDATEAVVADAQRELGPIRYLRQTHDVGPENNLISAFRAAAGEFVVYLADDDMLIAEALASAVAFMEQEREVAACYCPWELYDDVDGKSLGLFFRVDQLEHFEREDALSLFEFVVSGHVFPEIALYRRAALHKVLYRPHKAYFAHVFLARLLDHGGVAFLPYAFYRSITRHWEGEVRQQYGHALATRELDLVRGGLEFLLQRALEGTGRGALPEHDRRRYLGAIDRFMALRMKVALRLLVEEGDYVGAYDFHTRLMASGSAGGGAAAWAQQALMPGAAAQTLLETMDAMTAVRTIGLFGLADAEGARNLITRLRHGVDVRVLTDGDLPAWPDKDATLVLVGGAAERSKALAAGFRDGLLVLEPELTALFGGWAAAR